MREDVLQRPLRRIERHSPLDGIEPPSLQSTFISCEPSSKYRAIARSSSCLWEPPTHTHPPNLGVPMLEPEFDLLSLF
jgi:hypothetical protein